MHKNKMVLIGSIFVLLIMVLAACTQAAPTPTPTPTPAPTPTPTPTPVPPPAAPITFRISDTGTTSLNDNPNYINAYIMFQDLEKEYPGRFKLEYHPSSALYDDKNAQAAVFAGDVDAARSHCGMMLQQGGGIAANFALGLLPVWKNFDDNENAWQLLGPAISKDYLEPKGAMFALGTSTFGGPLCLKFDSKGVADFQGKKIRNPGGNFEADMMRALGMNPVAMAQAEVPTSLQTGVIDGVWTSLRSIVMDKQYKLAPYITPNNVPGVTGQSFLMWNVKSWNQFPQDVRDKLKSTIIPHANQVAAAAMRKIADTGQATAEADGAILSKWSDEAVAEYYKTVTPVVNKYASAADLKYRQLINKYSTIDLVAAK